jgi:hypothetical protein
MVPCQQLGVQGTSFILQGTGRGKDIARCWIPAKWVMMVQAKLQTQQWAGILSRKLRLKSG